MGWYFSCDPARNGNWKRELIEGLTYENEKRKLQVLDSALVERRTWYAAVESINKETGKREVLAAVYLLQFRPGEWGYKPMDESMGPCEVRCPEKILRLLTEPAPSADAKEWRERCWARVRKLQQVARARELGLWMRYTDGKLYKPVKSRKLRNVFEPKEWGQLVRFRESAMLLLELP